MKLVYISGLSRIGSTVIERVFDTSPSIFALGEFNSLWTLDFDTLACSCGSPVRSCNFWQPVLAEANVDERWRERMAELERRVAKHKFIAKYGLNLRKLSKDPDIREYIDRQQAIFTAVAERSGCDVLIDSTKFPQRAWILATLQDMLVVHLRRDSRHWLASVRSPKFDSGRGEMQIKYPFIKLIDGWLRCETSMALLARRTRLHEFSYEEFARDPRNYVQNSSLAGVLGQELAGIRWTGPASVTPSPDYHTIAGNPDRYQATQIDIRPKSTLTKLSRPERTYCMVFGSILNGLRHAF